ncbi:MAG: hypothetical protein ACFFC7_31130 [Candidatus Hermodarchaeota archaeon]
MQILLEDFIELGAMVLTVVILTYVTISVYRKNPSERLNQLFSLAAIFSMISFVCTTIGTLPGVTAEISILSMRLFITGIFWGVSALFFVAVYLNFGVLSKRLVALVVIMNSLLIIVWLPDSITANPLNPVDVHLSALLSITIFPAAIVFFLLIWYLFYRVYSQSHGDAMLRRKFRYFLGGWTIFIISISLAVLGAVLEGYGAILESHLLDAIGYVAVAIGCFVMAQAFRN